MATFSHAMLLLRALRAALCFAVAVGALGCGSKDQRSTGAAALPGLRGEPTRAERLGAAIEELEPAESLEKAAPPGVVAELRAWIHSFDKDERAALLEGGLYAEEHPLLHVAVGGTSSAALRELALGDGATRDLLRARRRARGDDADVSDLFFVARAVIGAAARQELSELAPKVIMPSAPSGLLQHAALLARALGKQHIELLALDALAAAAPSPAHQLALARALARAGNLERARALVAPLDQPDAASLRAALHAIHGAPQSRDERLLVARAYLELGRPDEALQVLAPERANAFDHLGLAVVVARALIDDDPCPGLPATAAEPALCAVAWSRSPSAREARALLSAALESTDGRDEASLETAIGLVHALPWRYATGTAREERRAALAEALERAVKEHPPLEPLLLFVRAASLSEQGTFTASALDALWSSVRPMAGRTEPDAVRALLAAAAIAMEHRPVDELLGALPDTLPAADSSARAHLAMWSALAADDSKQIAAARQRVTDVELRRTSALRRSEWVLLMAEAGALAAPADEHAADVLAEASRALSVASTPRALRLRAVLDAAAALSRRGEQGTAVELLERVRLDAPASGEERDLSYLVARYLGALRPAQESSEESAEQPVAADRRLDAWVSRWLKEDGARSPALPPRTLALVDRGALPHCDVELALEFHPARGLQPIVRVDARFIALAPRSTRP